MPSVRDARLALKGLVDLHGHELGADRTVCLRFLKAITSLDEVDVREVSALLNALTPSTADASTQDEPALIAAELRGLLHDGPAFSQRVRELATQRSVTKAMLAEAYRRLYRRQGGVRATAPKAELVQLLIDERNILQRHGTLQALTAR